MQRLRYLFAALLMIGLLVLAMGAAPFKSEPPVALMCSGSFIEQTAVEQKFEMYVYGWINECASRQIGPFVKNVEELATTLAITGQEMPPLFTSLTIRIHSPGGNWSDIAIILQALDRLRASGVKIRTIAEGVVENGAFWIWAAGDTRTVSPSGLLHPGWPFDVKRGWLAMLNKQADDRSVYYDYWIDWLAKRLSTTPNEVRAVLDANRWLDFHLGIWQGDVR